MLSATALFHARKLLHPRAQVYKVVCIHKKLHTYTTQQERTMTTIATISRRVREMTPEDELIGSFTKERVGLMVRYAGALSLEDGHSAGRHWLAYALDTDVPEHDYSQLFAAFVQAEETDTVDLEYWYGISNTAENRAALQKGADMTIDHCVILLTNRLAIQLNIRS